MRLQKGKVYVAYLNGGPGFVFAAIRVPPEPPFVLRTAGTITEMHRYVNAIWCDAITVPGGVLFHGKVENRPPAQSLRGKI